MSEIGHTAPTHDCKRQAAVWNSASVHRRGCKPLSIAYSRVHQLERRWIALLAAIMIAATPAAARAVDVIVGVPALNPAQNTQFSIDISADMGTTVLGSYLFLLRYDPAIVHVVSVDGGTAPEFSAPPETAPNTFATGSTPFAAAQGSRLSPSGLVSVAKVTFLAVGPPGGASTLNLGVLGLFDGDLNPLAATVFPSSVLIAGGTPGPLTPSPTRTSTASTPTRTPTSGSPTSTPNGVPTPTATRTPTPTASPTPFIAVNLGLAVGRPGGIACLGATLSSNSIVAASAGADISFDASRFTLPTCTIAPAIGPGSPANKQISQTPTAPGMATIDVGGNPAPLPSGALYACPFTVQAGTPLGSNAVANSPHATDPAAVPIPGVTGSAGQIIVTTCTGDCNGNGAVSIGEVVKCISMFLGQQACDASNASLGCPVADANNNGAVSVGEVTQCVNKFLGGC